VYAAAGIEAMASAFRVPSGRVTRPGPGPAGAPGAGLVPTRPGEGYCLRGTVVNRSSRQLRAPRALPDDEDRDLTFDELVDKYEKKLYNLILRHVGDPDEAADLTQDTFVNAFRGLPTFRGECKILTWLCQIALNQCKNRFRQRDRRRDWEGPSLDAPSGPDEGRLLEIPDWKQSPERALEAKELQRQILAAIDTLAPEYRTVIVLCDLQDRTYAEIAQIVGLSLETVKTRIHRGRLMLRRKLEAYLKI
jgi:RNA polymerase sigma-70 factor (ECF subfamily)